MLRIYLLAATAVLTACSGGFGTMDRVMSSWQGASLDEVISQWGYPAAQQDIAGRKLYHWDKTATLAMPSHTTGTANIIGNTAYINTTTYGGGLSHWSCRRTLEVNDSNMVVGWQWGGNNCPFATIGMGYENWPRRTSPSIASYANSQPNAEEFEAARAMAKTYCEGAPEKVSVTDGKDGEKSYTALCGGSEIQFTCKFHKKVWISDLHGKKIPMTYKEGSENTAPACWR